MQDYIVPNLHYLYDPSIKGRYFGEWDNIEMTEKSILDRIDGFLNFKDKSLEPNIFPSPLEMFKRISSVIRSQINFATITDSTHRTNFINGTHEPVISAFIFFLLKKMSDKSITKIDDIGGPIGFAEGLDILVFQDKNQEIKLELNFRGEELSI
ncbi:MAG: hypothetical protein Q9M91_08855 [Candidatus Dojkabacteria bacterium]|nr:hypothetical protein [Candidatus Dojkabacteria bacterium]